MRAPTSDFTPEEQVNIATFATDAARAQYHVYGLTGREERLVQHYFTTPGARVLDIGCGYGRTTVPLRDRGFRVLGVDIVPRMLDHARRSHPDIAWVRGSATDLCMRDEAVEYVLFSANGIDCIHPLARRAQALREIYRVLRPGGCFVYSSHNWIAQMITSVRRRDRRQTLWRNVRRHPVGPGYLRVRQGEGELVLYYGLPWSEIARLRQIGFRRVVLRSGKISPRLERCGRLGNVLFDAWPYYVAHR